MYEYTKVLVDLLRIGKVGTSTVPEIYGALEKTKILSVRISNLRIKREHYPDCKDLHFQPFAFCTRT